MKISPNFSRAHGLTYLAVVLATQLTALAQTVTPLIGGDSIDGLNLTGSNVIYAVDQGQGPSGTTLQGVNFIAAPIVNNTFTGYSGNVILSNMDRTDPGFSPVGYSSADDAALQTINSSISYGAFMQFSYQVTAGTSYTLYSIISPGMVSGRPSDVAFFDGQASAFSESFVLANSTLLADNLNVASNNASVLSYTYTAATTGFNTLIVAGSDKYGVTTGADQNAVSSGFLVAAIVPEPGTVGLLALSGLAVFAVRMRRLNNA